MQRNNSTFTRYAAFALFALVFLLALPAAQAQQVGVQKFVRNLTTGVIGNATTVAVGESFSYIIQYNAPAPGPYCNLVLRDTLAPEIDPSTVQVTGNTGVNHFTYDSTSRVVTWFFNGDCLAIGATVELGIPPLCAWVLYRTVRLSLITPLW